MGCGSSPTTAGTIPGDNTGSVSVNVGMGKSHTTTSPRTLDDSTGSRIIWVWKISISRGFGRGQSFPRFHQIWGDFLSGEPCYIPYSLWQLINCVLLQASCETLLVFLCLSLLEM